MTSNTTPSGVASASSIAPPTSNSFEAFKAFDRDENSSWCSIANPSFPQWISYEFPKRTTIYAYTIKSVPYASGNRSPKSWTLEGSNDGLNWIVLDTRTNEINWTTLERRVYIIENSTAFIKYRIFITDNNGGSYLQISEIELMGLNDKVLILSDGEYSTYQNSEWQTVTTSSPTEFDFLAYGMDEITMLNSQILSELNSSSGKVDIVYYINGTNKQEASLEITANYSPLDELDDPELLLWTDDDAESKELKVTAVPRPKLVMSLKDLDIKGDLQQLDLKATLQNQVDFLPYMTGNSTPPPYVVVASSEYNSTYAAWKAFNGTNLSATDSWGSIYDGTKAGWIKIYCGGRSARVSSYSITSRAEVADGAAPSSFYLEGSNDDNAWIQLDYRENQIGWGINEKRTYYNNIRFGSFKYYRLRALSNNGGNNIAIGMLELFLSLPNFIKIIASGDQGSTWKTFKQNTWQAVDISDLLNVKNNGMTADEVNSLTREDWLALNPNQKIRLAYYLEQENSTDIVQIDSLSSIERITTSTPTLDSVTIIYDELDKKYSGLMFMDTSEQYYSTSFGEILKYLDMGTLVAGQTSLDIKVKLTNTYPFDVKNIRLWSEHDIEGLTVEFSKSVNPFVAEGELIYDQQLNFDEVIEFYIRLNVNPSAQAGGNFDIRVSADPV